MVRSLLRHGLVIPLLLTLSGCGGLGTGERPRFGFYRGSITTVATNGIPAETAPAVLSVQQDGTIDSFAISTDLGVQIHSSGGQASYLANGVIITGKLNTAGSGRNLDIQFHSGRSVYFTGAFQHAPWPQVPPPSALPPGSYTGDLVQIGSGAVDDYGTAIATANADGTFTVIIESVAAGSVIGGGTLEPDGTISNCVLVENGTVYSQIAPIYGYDGTNWTLRFDRLRLDGLEAFVTLHADGTRPSLSKD